MVDNELLKVALISFVLSPMVAAVAFVGLALIGY